MPEKNVTICGKSYGVDYREEDGDWIAELTGHDRRTTAEGRGKTKDEALKNAKAKLKAR